MLGHRGAEAWEAEGVAKTEGQESHCPGLKPLPLVRVIGRIQREGPRMHPTLYTGLVNASSVVIKLMDILTIVLGRSQHTRQSYAA